VDPQLRPRYDLQQFFDRPVTACACSSHRSSGSISIELYCPTERNHHRQGRRACYGPLWPAPYLKPKEIFSTPAFQPSPTSKEQGNCRASASLAPPALHPALPALPPLDPDPRSPSRRAPIVHSPRAAEQRRGPSARSLAKRPSRAAARRPLADSPLGGSAATGRPAPGGPARSALRPPLGPRPRCSQVPMDSGSGSSINRKGKRKAVGFGRGTKKIFLFANCNLYSINQSISCLL